ncbi:hypothetical protein ABZV80_44700 [Streptomyces sp. NPDC005132]|uniref:hypothetical protein n=1 Tax=Streptomyces sp. NPDC005132 TaxID=3154294 RepID=UPI0033BB924D
MSSSLAVMSECLLNAELASAEAVRCPLPAARCPLPAARCLAELCSEDPGRSAE